MILKSGLTSVTFRQLPPEEIIRLTRDAGLDGIEWGADIHVKPGELAKAKKIAEMTKDAGLEVLSYGSYFRPPVNMPAEGEIVLETAVALGAPNVRIWAGDKDASVLDDAGFRQTAEAISVFTAAAGAYGLTVSTEYHHNTATSTIHSTRRLLDAVPLENFYTYFQPDNVCTEEENLQNLREIADRVSNLHVFHWKSWTERYPLEQGAEIWKQYLQAFLTAGHGSGACILEFVKDDSPEQFLRDAEELKRWLAEWNGKD